MRFWPAGQTGIKSYYSIQRLPTPLHEINDLPGTDVENKLLSIQSSDFVFWYLTLLHTTNMLKIWKVAAGQTQPLFTTVFEAGRQDVFQLC